jgi:acyl-CoA dehydrogenase
MPALALAAQMPAHPAAPPSEEAFLAEVRAFLDRALTPDLRQACRDTLGVHAEIEACRIWHRRLYEQGWIAPAWPVEWGGPGWTPRQRFLFDRECAGNDAPTLFAGGIRSLGPLLIEQGTPEQRARYLPAILDGSDLWAQGFSEPGAGSDLAAISTRAERQGDRYIVNGSKIWTTGAQYCNRMFAIVRTADLEKRQQGMTFLLIDMASPGLTVRPIIDLAGRHEFNQVFFDNVAVPVENRVGAENDGWTMAKRLMAMARSNNTPAALVRRSLRRAQALIAAQAPDPDLRRRLAGLAIELESFEQLELNALPDGRPRPGDQTAPSMLKLIGTELHQRVCELTLEAAGPAGMAALTPAVADDPWLDAGAHATAKHLSVRAATIYSGTSETQRNVIAGQLLAR